MIDQHKLVLADDSHCLSCTLACHCPPSVTALPAPTHPPPSLSHILLAIIGSCTYVQSFGLVTTKWINWLVDKYTVRRLRTKQIYTWIWISATCMRVYIRAAIIQTTTFACRYRSNRYSGPPTVGVLSVRRVRLVNTRQQIDCCAVTVSHVTQRDSRMHAAPSSYASLCCDSYLLYHSN